MTPEVKVLQVQCIVPRLIQCMPRKLPFPYLKFHSEDHRPGNHHRIHTTSDPWNYKLQKQMTINPCKPFPQDSNLFHPGIPLREIDCELCTLRHLSQHLFISGDEEFP